MPFIDRRIHWPPLAGAFALIALTLTGLPPLYAALCVRLDGCAVWGLYPFLVPFAVCYGLRRSAPR